MKNGIICLAIIICLLSLVGCQNSNSDNSIESSASEVQTEHETLLSRNKDNYTDDVTDQMLKRTPNKYIDKEFKLTGDVIAELKYDGEVTDRNGNVHTGEESSQYISAYYIAVNGNDDDIVVLMYYKDTIDYSLLINDNVTMYGTLLEEGVEFERNNGTIMNIPAVMAVMIDLNN